MMMLDPSDRVFGIYVESMKKLKKDKVTPAFKAMRDYFSKQNDDVRLGMVQNSG
jgi:hypothetical protein